MLPNNLIWFGCLLNCNWWSFFIVFGRDLEVLLKRITIWIICFAVSVNNFCFFSFSVKDNNHFGTYNFIFLNLLSGNLSQLLQLLLNLFELLFILFHLFVTLLIYALPDVFLNLIFPGLQLLQFLWFENKDHLFDCWVFLTVSHVKFILKEVAESLTISLHFRQVTDD